MKPQLIIGFDYSLRKIGVATGQTLTATATALTTLINPSRGVPDWKAVDHIIEQWSPSLLVVGLPLTMTGEEQQTSQYARDFAEQLKQRYQLPVSLMDERLSSREASHILGYDGITAPRRESKKGRKVKKSQRRGDNIDAMAAQLILQSWLNSQ